MSGAKPPQPLKPGLEGLIKIIARRIVADAVAKHSAAVEATAPDAPKRTTPNVGDGLGK